MIKQVTYSGNCQLKTAHWSVATPIKFWITLIVVALSTLAAQAQELLVQHEYPKGAAKIKVTNLFGSLPTRGYVPVQVEIQNRTNSDRVWSLDFISQDGAGSFWYRGSREDNTMDSSYALSCAAGESKNYELLVPVVAMFTEPGGGYDENHLSLEVKINSSGLPKAEGYMSWSQSAEWSGVLLSEDLGHKNSNDLDSRLNSLLLGSRGHTNSEFAGEFRVKDLPGDWRAYVGYEAIVLTDSDWLGASPAARNAILEWNRLGGHLIVYSEDSQMDLKRLGIPAGTEGEHADRSFGRVDLLPLGKNFGVNAKELVNLIHDKSPQLPYAKQLIETYDYSDWGLYQLLKGEGFKPAMLVVVLLVFGILVGPINLFVFAKPGKRHRMFITTPLIAIGASLVLILVIIIQDGFGGAGERVQLVEVRADNGEYKSYIKQQQFCRTGVLLNGNFETSTNAFISPVPLEESRLARVTIDNLGGGGVYRLSQGETGTAGAGDWFQSRSQLGHYLEAVAPTRARVTLAGDSEKPVLHSGFDFSVATLLYLDPNGQWWSSNAAVQQGAKVTATKISAGAAKNALWAGCALFTEELRVTTVNKLMKRKGHFFAITKDAPAIDTHASIDWEHTHSVFTGPVVN